MENSPLWVAMARVTSLRFSLVATSLGLLTGCATQMPVSATQSISQQALTGATAQMLNADFGPPLLRRVDGPAQVWLYQTPTCNLDIFLYPDPNGNPRVRAVLADDGANPQSCMQNLTRSTMSAALEHNPTS